jgi:uncharacterized protein
MKTSGGFERTLFILLALLVSLSLSVPVLAQCPGAKTVNIKAVAVTSGESPRGAVINITVSVTPGDGRVFVSTTPYTEIDMQGSAQLAALTACDLLGIDFTNYDFFYTIEADAPIVGGPSAGAVMTVATIAAIKDLKIRNDVFMTGMIYPDGFIGPVGGLTYKLDAAAKSGGKIFLVPKGQTKVYVEEKETKRIGMIYIITPVTKEVDLVEYGKERGVNVYEVETINDALRFYTGYEIKKPEANFTIGEYSPLLKKLAEEMEKSVNELQSKISSEKASELIKEAKDFYNKGMYYTATSRYFEAKIYLRYALYQKEITTPEQFDAEVAKIKAEIDGMKEYLANQKVGVNSFQLFAAAEERIGEAENALKTAQTTTNEDPLYYLAYAKERVESAKVWLSLLPEIKNDYEIYPGEIEKRAEFYINQAGSLLVYANSLGGYSSLLDRAYQSLETSKSLFTDGFYAGAAVLAVQSITDSSLSIELKYGDVQDKLSKVEEEAKISLSEAEKSVFPVLPAAYFEFAKTSDNIYAQIMYYTLSERLAKLLTMISKSGGEKQLIHAAFTPPPPQVKEKSRIREIVESPGFEFVPTIIAILAVVLVSRYRKSK